jgi:hypothetical protein
MGADRNRPHPDTTENLPMNQRAIGPLLAVMLLIAACGLADEQQHRRTAKHGR